MILQPHLFSRKAVETVLRLASRVENSWAVACKRKRGGSTPPFHDDWMQIDEMPMRKRSLKLFIELSSPSP